MPYLILNDARRFLDFAKEVFGATEKMLVPGNNGRTIMHGELLIGNAVVMFANATDEWNEKTSGMFLYVNDVDAVHKKALANNATELASPMHKDYGYSSGFEDPFGNQWWITDGAAE